MTPQRYRWLTAILLGKRQRTACHSNPKRKRGFPGAALSSPLAFFDAVLSCQTFGVRRFIAAFRFVLGGLFLQLALQLSWLFNPAPVCGQQEHANPAVVRSYLPRPLPRPAQPVEGFQAFGGSWEVRRDEVWASAGPGPKLIYDSPKLAAGEVGVEVFLPDASDGNAGLIVRVSQPGVGADAFVGYEIALDAHNQMLRLGRHRNNFELIRDVPCTVPVGRWIALAVKLGETSLEISVDGQKVLEHNDGNRALPAGCVGLRPWQREVGYRDLWIKTGEQIRKVPFLADPAQKIARDELALTNLPPIVALTRHPFSRPNTISCAIWQSQPARPGCSIRIIDPSRPEEPAKIVFADPDGCIFDMNVSFDARTLYFSYRPEGEQYWHLYRIGADGHGLQQLTDGPFHDISPTELPSANRRMSQPPLAFVSTRCGGYTLCQPGPSSSLYRLSAAGDVQCMSMNTLADFSPQMLPDGRILFTRWEYVDRDLTYRQSLWTQNPDGSGYQLYFGNTIRDVGTFWQARPLPGRSEIVVATFAPHHGWPHGAIGLITNRYGLETPRGEGFAWITKEFPDIGDHSFQWSYRDPFPLSNSQFLVSYGGDSKRFGIYLLGLHGDKRLVYEDPQIGCYNPIPLRPMPQPQQRGQPVPGK